LLWIKYSNWKFKSTTNKSDFSDEQKQEIMDMIKELSKEENNDTSKEK
jgi:hypothetical protein